MPIRDSLPPPSSARGPFPLLMKSAAMQLFVKYVAKNAHPARIMPILAGRNTLEIAGFIRHLLQRFEITESDCQTYSSRSPSFTELVKDEPELLVYTSGDAIPAYVQAGFAGKCFSHTRIIAFITKPVEELTRCERGAGPPNWQAPFAAHAAKAITWPTWNQRADDQRDLILEMYRRLSMPHGRPRPELTEDALRALLTIPHEGTCDVDERLKSAWTKYIETQSRGPITERLILGSQVRRALESRGDLPSS